MSDPFLSQAADPKDAARLRDRLASIAQTPVLLVACDFDGTLAPLVDDPMAAAPHPGAMEALVALSSLDHTHAAMISGRGRDDLASLSGAPGSVLLIGSHGAESPDLSPAHGAEVDAMARLDELEREVQFIARATPGALVERKPLAVAIHVRQASPEDARRALAEVMIGPAKRPDVFVREGSNVLELCLLSPSDGADKGTALTRLRERVGATAVMFLGDDKTDAEALRTLRQNDTGVIVGDILRDFPDPNALRVQDPVAVGEVLQVLLELRRAWLRSHRHDPRALVPIERFSILSDQRTLAVIDPRARVVWYCAPRVDSSAVFADLVAGVSDSTAGRFEIAPEDGADPIEQYYEKDSFVLVTRYPNARITDYMDCSLGRAFQRAGRSDLVRVIEGTGSMRLSFSPRMDFGRVRTRLRLVNGGLEVEGTAEPMVLHSPNVEWNIRDEAIHQTAEAVVSLDNGPIILELRSGTANARANPISEPERRANTQRFWSGWAGALKLPPLHQDVVKRSALVIKALAHGPTGAILAAATTSLPEHLGGVRNWDYRFCWPRDASLSAAALVRLGNTGHALKLLDWLLAVVDQCETPDRLRPIYTVTGNLLPPEAELGHLAGYGDSRPVRISNAAAFQVQLDVFGPIADLVALLAERGAPISPDHWRLVRAMVQAVEARWMDPDHGIWEIRTDRRHHVHSKVMCWLTVDRALRVMDAVLGRTDASWERLRDSIRDDILANGFNTELNSFTSAYGTRHIDAATLWVGLSGMIPPDDPRFAGTIAAIERTLLAGPVVFRYHEDDGLPGVEGGMLICAGWLVESLAMVGRRDEARTMLDNLASLVGPTGIAPEQYCPRHKIALGNIAQAYSHLAIINAAVRLSEV